MNRINGKVENKEIRKRASLIRKEFLREFVKEW